jgi:hypothetical protein
MGVIAAQTRDALVSQIQAMMVSSILTPTIPVQAVYDIVFNLNQLQGGQVIVMAAQKEPALLMRQPAVGQQNDLQLHVAVQYKYTTPSALELDPFMALIENIETQILGLQLSNGAWCVGATYPHGLYLERHIQEFRTFTSVVALKFKLNI